MLPYIPHIAVGGSAFLPNTIISLSWRTAWLGFLFQIYCAAGMPHLLQLRIGMLKHAAMLTRVRRHPCLRREGCPWTHYRRKNMENWFSLRTRNASSAKPIYRMNRHAEACFHADEEAMMAGLHHSLIRDDSDRFAVTIFVKFARFVFARKNRLLTPSNLNFFSSWVEQPNDRFGFTPHLLRITTVPHEEKE